MTSETNAERINLIKSRNGFLLHFMDDVGNGLANLQSIYNDLAWLIEQAERTQKLEAKVESLQVENARLREALAFYADEERYQPYVAGKWVPVIEVLEDNGNRARESLTGEANGQRKA